MKAITQEIYGGPEVLRLSALAVPVPAADEVLLQVRAAGVDQATWHRMTGLPLLARLALGLRAPKQTTVGTDVAGIVHAIGSAVTDFAVGDEVYGVARGSFAEFALAKPRQLAPKPAKLTFEQAAAIPTSVMTALQGLRGRVTSGDRVLVLGAAGGVGGFAVQLAKSYGADVTGAASASKLDIARQFGADQVVDYATDALGTSYDVVIDTGGNRPLRELRSLLSPTGTAVIVGGEGAGGPVLAGFDRQLRAGIQSLFLKQNLVGLTAVSRGSDLVELAPLIESGAVFPIIDSTFPLSQAPDAISRLRAPDRRGKVTISLVE